MAASTATAYRNSDDSQSANQRHFFTRAEIEEFFETCPAELLSRRFRHFLRGMWIAAGRPFGGDVQLFKAVGDYRKACYYRSDSTVRYNLRAAEDLGLLEIAHKDRRGNCHHIWIRPRTDDDRGLYRRVTTHRLPISLLAKWRHARRQEREVTPIRKPAQPTPPPKSPAPAAPLPQRPAAGHRSTERSEGRHTYRETKKFMELIDWHAAGFHGAQGMRFVDEHAQDYRAPLNRALAFKRACEDFRWSVESAIEAMKRHGFKLAEQSP